MAISVVEKKGRKGVSAYHVWIVTPLKHTASSQTSMAKGDDVPHCIPMYRCLEFGIRNLSQSNLNEL